MADTPAPASDNHPHAPVEFRGPFQPIATRLPGVQICELMPLQAQIMDRIALLRGVRFFGAGKRTHSVVMTTDSRHIRFVDTVHVEGGPDAVIRF